MKWDHIGLNQTNYSKLPEAKMSGAQLAKLYAQKQVSRQALSSAYGSKEH